MEAGEKQFSLVYTAENDECEPRTKFNVLFF